MMSSCQQRKVRVIARVRGLTELESGDVVSAKLVSVHKPAGDRSEFVSVFYGDQPAGEKDSYKLDNCYGENEDCGLIYTNEVKPLISGVFDGCDCTVIAYGARGSGKTHLIQGSNKEPGLSVLAMAEMLRMAEEREKSITVSIYEIYQDNVYDLLVPERPLVHVLEAQGTIQLKGLSQVPVKSVLEFQNLYCGGKKLRNPTQKVTIEPPHRSHKGLMIYVSSYNADSGTMGKMNFVDLAGYEDTRRQSIDGQYLIEVTKINKSIYALLNVMYALNANECHVPYRESKLTRMLKDSLQGANRTLLIACLSPSFGQDSINMLNLASRSCQGNSRTMLNSTKKTNSVAKAMVTSSQNPQIPRSVSATAKKQTASRLKAAEMKTKGNAMASSMKAKKLFPEASRSTKSEKASKKEISSLEIVSNVPFSLAKEESSTSAAFSSEASITADKIQDVSFHDGGKYEGAGPSVSGTITEELTSLDKDLIEDKENKSSAAKEHLSSVGKGQAAVTENNSSLVRGTESPPLSLQLQKLADKLKSFYPSATPSIEMPEKKFYLTTPMQLEVLNNDTSVDGINVEPRTPENSIRSNISSSPWQTFTVHNSKAKNSLVDEYLRFLNTAEKEDLKKLKGIGEKRATYIVELRKESPEPFKSLDDLNAIGLSAKQVKGMLRKEVGELFD